jgi:hypothetical protein
MRSFLRNGANLQPQCHASILSAERPSPLRTVEHSHYAVLHHCVGIDPRPSAGSAPVQEPGIPLALGIQVTKLKRVARKPRMMVRRVHHIALI